MIPDYESEMERDSNVERVFMVYYEWGVLLQKRVKLSMIELSMYVDSFVK